jgi:hypothetical protein
VLKQDDASERLQVGVGALQIHPRSSDSDYATPHERNRCKTCIQNYRSSHYLLVAVNPHRNTRNWGVAPTSLTPYLTHSLFNTLIIQKITPLNETESPIRVQIACIY